MSTASPVVLGEVTSPMSAQGGAGPGPSSSRAAKASRSQRGLSVVVGRHAVGHAALGIGTAHGAAAAAQAGPSRANLTVAAPNNAAAPAPGRRNTPASMRVNGDIAAAPAARTQSAPAGARNTTAAPHAAPAQGRDVVELVDLAGEASDDEVVLVGVKPAARPVVPRPGLTLKRTRTPAKAAAAPAAAPAAVLQEPPSPPGYKCPICLERVDRMATTPCGHVFCEGCLTMAIKARKQCPKCRKAVQLRQIHRIFLTD